MPKKETWHPLTPSDARNLTDMLAQFNSRSQSGQRRMHVTLYLWSRLWDERGGTPYFRCGERTIAKECGVSYKAVRKYFDAMEPDWLVKLDEPRTGRAPRRTFVWLMGETAPQDDETAPQKGRTLRPKHQQKGRTTAPLEPQNGAHINSNNCNSGGVTPHTAYACAGFTLEPELRPEDIDPRELSEIEW